MAEKATENLAAIPGSETKAMFACGHEDFDKFSFDVWGRKLELDDEYLASKTKCSACQLGIIKATFIRCGVCGHAIRPGQGVAGCNDDPRLNPAWKKIVNGIVLCCLRCLPPGFFCGQWDGERHVGLEESGLVKVMRQSTLEEDGYVGGYIAESLSESKKRTAKKKEATKRRGTKARPRPRSKK